MSGLAAMVALDDTWPCTWLLAAGRDEDGKPMTRECGAPAHELPASRGYECDAGHNHVYADVRDREGWDYDCHSPQAEETLLRSGLGSA